LGTKLAGRTRLTLVDRFAGGEVHSAELSISGDWTWHFADVEAVVRLAGNRVACHDWPELLGPIVDTTLFDRDYLHRIECCLTAQLPEPFQIVNGMSANTAMPWDSTTAGRVVGYSRRDDVMIQLTFGRVNGSPA
jgi:hypothetical protein